MLLNYKSIIFDCDGVLLNSNNIKSQAFFEIGKNFGEDKGKALLNYHRVNGGISRNEKFTHFITKILNKEFNEKIYNDLLNQYSSYVFNKLLSCEVTHNLENLRKLDNKKWFIVSGGNENELIKVFKKRQMLDYFDGGIYGSPRNKIEIFKNLIEDKKISNPAIYLGDSKYDYYASKEYGIDFTFIYNWTELKEWKKFCLSNKIKFVREVKCLF